MSNSSPEYIWESNPYAFGAYSCRLGGRKIGSVSNVGGFVSGYWKGALIYEGTSEETAMRRIENFENSFRESIGPADPGVNR